MITIHKDNYKQVISEGDRINIDVELEIYFKTKDSEGYCEASQYIFDKYYDIDGIPVDFYLEAFYWIATAVRDYQLKEIKNNEG